MTNPMGDELHIEYMSLNDLVARMVEENPKDHDLGQLHRSLDTFGYVTPPMIDEGTKYLVAGHGRVTALLQQRNSGKPAPKRIQVTADGDWLVPVIRGIAFDNPNAARAYLVADNQLAIMGGWLEQDLVNLLQDLAESAPEMLEATGFTGDDLDALAAELEGLALHPPERTVVLPDEKLNRFMNATVKQLVFYFDTDRYEQVVVRLKELMDTHNLNNHTEVFELLLSEYGANHETATG